MFRVYLSVYKRFSSLTPHLPQDGNKANSQVTATHAPFTSCTSLCLDIQNRDRIFSMHCSFAFQVMFNLANNLKAAGRNADAVDMYAARTLGAHAVCAHTRIKVCEVPVCRAVQCRVLCSSSHHIGQHRCVSSLPYARNRASRRSLFS